MKIKCSSFLDIYPFLLRLSYHFHACIADIYAIFSREVLATSSYSYPLVIGFLLLVK